MLVLTRKSHEQIQIGDNITITILRVKGGAIRVGIDAPKSLSVLRKELVGKPVNGAATTSQSAADELAEVVVAPVAARKARGSAVRVGGKKTSLPTLSHQNPTRSRGASPLGRFLVRA